MATLTETLSNGLKSLFSGLGKKTTGSDYAVPLLNDNGAQAQGYMGFSDLAVQMQGSLEHAYLVSDTAIINIDNLETPYRLQTYTTTATAKLQGDVPHPGAMELVVEYCSYGVMQTAYRFSHPEYFFRRWKSFNDGDTWSPWYIYTGTLQQS